MDINGTYVEHPIQDALEDAGVIFIDADEEGPGVRLKANPAGQ